MAAEEPDAAHLASLAHAPEEADIAENLGDVWQSFWRLSADRSAHVVTIVLPMGGLSTKLLHRPISFAAIDAYAARFGYEGEAFDELLRLVSAMDEEWLRVISDLAEG